MSGEPPPPLPQRLLELGLVGGTRVGVDAQGELEIVRAGHPPERRPLAPGLRWPTPVVGCVSPTRSCCLIGLARHDLLLVIRAAADIERADLEEAEAADLEEAAPVRRLELGPRLAGSLEMALHPAGRGFVVVLECGVIRLDERGDEIWRLDRVTVGWRFVAERDGALWLEDREGNLVGFDSRTGFERL